MEPTLHINQRVLVDRIGSHFSSPSVGDIVVFHPPTDYQHGARTPSRVRTARAGQRARLRRRARPSPPRETFIKRVVGLPGDRISIVDGHVIRNGVREKDPYIERCLGASECNFPATITVPRGDYYMMGDNRPDSEDSRFWGPVPKAWIIGQAFMTYWPPDRVGFL